ncbi:esterase/lipase/thioesterase family protein [Winogradskyella psychrotolerans RS-3]|uniref:Esterase/lipase/thioesterase family protein n=1 Tax=Winogradskyella psychrotolerans RS-3 TaxID=641526 RepID=S7X8P9_9FLAO|nr:prolyl oligopeptidase family serine peptidase [Winogradskyella psychrotolerans]EPR72418.1 esterase/lipase/thioesterase family protein [Winogradskyella psychrotolerans RS-3]
MIIDKNIILERGGKKPILIDAFYSEEKTNQPIIIFCHGYKGFKDWGAWNLMAERIAAAGFCFIKFNFSHNGGTMENPIDFPDLEAFGNNNYTKELDDLDAVMTWAQNRFESNSKINTNVICLIGHSRGGGITILKASEDTRITKLITLASVSDFGNRFGTEDEIKNWKEEGVKYVVNGRTKQQMPHYYQFFEDFKAHEKSLNIESATKQIDIPILIIHGDNDTGVNINEAYSIYEWSKNSKLEIISGGDHVFNTKHPWNENNPSGELNTVINSITEFVK